MAESKLGPHGILATPEAVAWARVAPVIKSIDNIAILEAAHPDAIRIFRHWWDREPLDGDPAWIAAVLIDSLHGYRHPRLYVEVINEAGQTLAGGLQRHVTVLRAVTKILHANGYQVAGFSFSTGQPERVDWGYLAASDFAGVDLISLHEYWGSQGFSGWHALRYRKVHGWLGDQHPPFVITECGRDRVEGGNGGWRRDGVSAAAYTTELQSYDRELQQDAYVLGATVFTAGPTLDWEAFSTDGLGLERGFRLETTPMDLQDQFPQEYAAWVAAGGIRNNFRKHVLGRKLVKATIADVKFLADECNASVTQLREALTDL